MKIVYALIAVLLLSGLAWYILNTSETPDGEGAQNQQTLNQERSMNLEEAQTKIGMECIGSDASMECTWNETEYGFMIPADWEDDRAKRIQACEQGYINDGYNMVTDGETWYATANFEEENSELVNAFDEIGFKSSVASYCR